MSALYANTACRLSGRSSMAPGRPRAKRSSVWHLVFVWLAVTLLALPTGMVPRSAIWLPPAQAPTSSEEESESVPAAHVRQAPQASNCRGPRGRDAAIFSLRLQWLAKGPAVTNRVAPLGELSEQAGRNGIGGPLRC